jgi:hypothetical protein
MLFLYVKSQIRESEQPYISLRWQNFWCQVGGRNTQAELYFLPPLRLSFVLRFETCNAKLLLGERWGLNAHFVLEIEIENEAVMRNLHVNGWILRERRMCRPRCCSVSDGFSMHTVVCIASLLGEMLLFVDW